MVGYNPDTNEVTGPYAVCLHCYLWAETGEIGDAEMIDLSDDAERFSLFALLERRLIDRGWTKHDRPVRDYWCAQTYRFTKGGRTLLVMVDDEWQTIIHVERAGEK
jgi:hypothetical protein